MSWKTYFDKPWFVTNKSNINITPPYSMVDLHIPYSIFLYTREDKDALTHTSKLVVHEWIEGMNHFITMLIQILVVFSICRVVLKMELRNRLAETQAGVPIL